MLASTIAYTAPLRTKTDVTIKQAYAFASVHISLHEACIETRIIDCILKYLYDSIEITKTPVLVMCTALLACGNSTVMSLIFVSNASYNVVILAHAQYIVLSESNYYYFTTLYLHILHYRPIISFLFFQTPHSSLPTCSNAATISAPPHHTARPPPPSPYH